MFFSKLNVCSPPRSVRFGTESSQVHSITIFHRGSILLPQFHCKASLIIVSSGLFQRSTFSTRAWRQPCSWTSTWKRTRSSNWTKRLARIRASSRWLFLETKSFFVFSSSPIWCLWQKTQYDYCAGELQEAGELCERSRGAVRYVATLRGQGGGW